jgi:hypothetical protein
MRCRLTVSRRARPVSFSVHPQKRVSRHGGVGADGRSSAVVGGSTRVSSCTGWRNGEAGWPSGSPVLFAITLVLRYGYDTWWPAGIVLATICGLIGLFTYRSR